MKPAFETACVIGLGYVGLPTAAILASRGIRVLGVDVNPRAIEYINRGAVHIVEPDLPTLVQGAVSTGHLRASVAPEPADVFIIAVPTPFENGHKPDLSHVRAATGAIAPVLAKGNLVIVESTSPVGTTEQVAAWLAELRPDLTFPRRDDENDAADICLAYSPERVLPGRVLLELVRNDRVIGGLTPRCAERAASLYRIVVAGECFTTDSRTAELVKLAENAYRDVNIAFANELSLVCDRLELDPWAVIGLANRHPRVEILRPGPGVGGHCIAVDPWFIVDAAPDRTPLIQTARRVNDGKPDHVVARVRDVAGHLAEPRVACLGLSYKANTDDLRESPAVRIVEGVCEFAAEVLVVEPHRESLPPNLERHPKARLVTLEEALERADIIVLLVDHAAFKAVDRNRLGGKAVIDTRGFWRD